MTTDAVDFAVVAESIEKRYGDLVAVRGIDFRVAAGERFGLLGPDGAGKTSTMMMIYGRTAVTAGRLMVLGLDVARHPLEVKRRLGVVPQDNNLDPDLTARENLVQFARFYGYCRREAGMRADAGLERFGLSRFGKARPGELSGGMKRRLVTAARPWAGERSRPTRIAPRGHVTARAVLIGARRRQPDQDHRPVPSALHVYAGPCR